MAAAGKSDGDDEIVPQGDWKSELNVLCGKKKEFERFQFNQEERNGYMWEVVQVSKNNRCIARAEQLYTGGKKERKEAQQRAAFIALRKLGKLPPSDEINQSKKKKEKANGNGTTNGHVANLAHQVGRLSLDGSNERGTQSQKSSTQPQDGKHPAKKPSKPNIQQHVDSGVRALLSWEEDDRLADSVEFENDTGADEDSDREMDLLPPDRGNSMQGNDGNDTVDKAPLFSRPVLERNRNSLLQYGVLGSLADQEVPLASSRVYINTNVPFTGIICGVQGKGKSHTLSTILESCLIKDRQIGYLRTPLSAMVCHVDPQGGRSPATTHPCEAVSLALPAEGKTNCVNSVTVVVSPSNFRTMKTVYREVAHVNVQPFFLSEKDLDVTNMDILMATDDTDSSSLYMSKVHQILREMGDEFNYDQFTHRLEEIEFNSAQRAMLQLRLDLLESFLLEKVMNKTEESLPTPRRVQELFQPGGLVIVDLTDPLIPSSAACAYFNVVIDIFSRAQVSTGKVLVLDEAHKYLSQQATAKTLMWNVSRLIRERRHNGISTLISTQDPTSVGSDFLELSSFLILHCFQSFRWAKFLQGYFGTYSDSLEDSSEQEGIEAWLQRISSLYTGQAMIYCPDGFFPVDVQDDIQPLLRNYIRVMLRNFDGYLYSVHFFVFSRYSTGYCTVSRNHHRFAHP
eukprot:gb/GECG01016537.1/.p1 GENE.gb/GECG01016537.1/~~gb/GECG01016537.1/.p1  ORF type:complete len:683 (+),score=80.82 gb/GECG01016537.1/:1-2049(+)